ncbi:MAG: hypothetical protein ACRCX2_20120 [Paraclostridium sp.]
MTKAGKLEKRIREIVEYVVAGYENDVLDGNELTEREYIIKDAYENVMCDENATELKFFGKDNTIELIKKVIKESDELDSALIQMEAKESVEKRLEELREEEVNTPTEEERKAADRKGSLDRADILVSILESKNLGKKITQKYKIMYLFSYFFEPAIIAEALNVKFQVVRKHVTDEIKEGLREFNKKEHGEQQEIRYALRDKYPEEIK